MIIKTLNVFYGADCLPYKDKERVVHFPVVEPAVQGSSQVNQIKFYVDSIGGSDCQWLLVAKLPNGKVGMKLLDTYNDSDGTYALFNLENWFTQVQGALTLSLKGYDGGTEITYDSETETYHIEGNPVIQATGIIKMDIRYSTPVIDAGSLDEITLQQLLAEISFKLDKNSDKYFKVVNNIANINTSTYSDYLSSGDIVYDYTNKKLYELSLSDDTLVAEEINGVVLKSPNIQSPYVEGDAYFEDWVVLRNWSDLIFQDETLETVPQYVANAISNASDTYVTLATNQTISGNKTFSGNVDFAGFVGDLISDDGTLGNASYQWKELRVQYIKGKEQTYGLVLPSATTWSDNQTIATEEYVQEYAYSKSDVDSIVSSIKADELQVVEELPEEGEEGIIYLVPISDDPSEGYYRYIWENNTWLSLGTTEIDLSGYLEKTSQTNKVYGTNGSGIQTLYDIASSATGNTIPIRNSSGNISVGTATDNSHAASAGFVDANYVPKSRTIAGNSLYANISASALTDSLVFMNNTTDIDYVMGD